jgi:hypothetical protein
VAGRNAVLEPGFLAEMLVLYSREEKGRNERFSFLFDRGSSGLARAVVEELGQRA